MFVMKKITRVFTNRYLPLFFYFILSLISLQVYGDSPKRLYIQGIPSKSEPKIAMQAQAGLLEGLTTETNNLIVLDDDALAALLKQAGLAISFSNDKDGFIEQIAKSPYKPDFLVYSDFQNINSSYFFQVTLLEISELGTYTVRKTTNFSCENFQVLYFTREVGRGLFNPNYIIQKDKAPSLDRIEPFSFSLSSVSDPIFIKPNLEKNETDRDLLNSLFDYVNEADLLYKKGAYTEAEETYGKIILALESLRSETKQRLSKFIDSVILRRQNTSGLLWKARLDKEKIKFSSPENIYDNKQIDQIIKHYTEIFSEWNQLPISSKNIKVERAIQQSLQSLFMVRINNSNRSIDESIVKRDFDLAHQKALDSLENTQALDSNSVTDKSALIKKSSQRLSEVQKLGKIYLSRKVEILLDIAEKENTLSLIETKIGNEVKAKTRKDLAIFALQDARNVIIGTSLIDPSFKQLYNILADSVNKDIATEFSLRSIALVPIHYLENIFYGITNIFVFRPGYGLEFGAEIAIFNANLGMTQYLSKEYSTGWENKSPLINRQRNIIKREGSYGYGIIGEGYNCYSYIGFRICGLDGNLGYNLDTEEYYNAKPPKEIKTIDQYTTIELRATPGFGGNLTIETHRLVELFGILAFQDWDLYNSGFKRQKYFQRKKAKKF